MISLACAALRELYRARLGNCPLSDCSSGELTRSSRVHLKEGNINSDTHVQADGNNYDNSIGELEQTQSEHASLVGLNDADDEFYDVPEPSDCDESENGWTTECSHQKSQVKKGNLFNTAAFVTLQRNEQSTVIIVMQCVFNVNVEGLL